MMTCEKLAVGGDLSYSATTGRPLKKSAATSSNSLEGCSFVEFWLKVSVGVRKIASRFVDNQPYSMAHASFLLRFVAVPLLYS